MIKISLLQICLRVIPEALIFYLGVFILNSKKLNIKSYTLAALIYILCSYIIKSLPIDFGVHSLLILTATICTIHILVKIPITQSISSALILYIALAIGEWTSFLMFDIVFGLDSNKILLDPVQSSLYGLPSLFIFIFLVISFCFFKLKRKERIENDVFDKKIIR